METLSVKDVVIKKFGFFLEKDPDFCVKELEQKCCCGSKTLCVCYRKSTFTHDRVVASHFCLNVLCHNIQTGDREAVKEGKLSHGIGFCPLCWREIDK